MTEPVATRGLTGKAYELQPGQVADAANAGLKEISPQEASSSHKAWTQMRDLDANWSAPEKALGGVFNGLTLGLGPAALAGMGLADRGDIEALHGSSAFQAGDIAGMVAPAFLTGGEGVAARGALEAEGGLLGRALGWTPAGLMSRAGAGAEALAGRLIPEVGVLGKAGKATLSMAARGGTEGAIVNLAHTVSDSYIQDKPLTAQSLAASGVNGVLLGGLAGGILGGVTAVAGAGADAVVDTALRAGAGKGEAAAATALERMGVPKSTIAKMAGDEGAMVRAVRGYHDTIEANGANFASSTSDIAKAIDKSATGYAKGIDDIVTTLDREAASAVPDVTRVTGRIQSDLAHYAGTFQEGQAAKVMGKLTDQLNALRAAPQDLASLRQISELAPNAGGTWLQWSDSRNQLAEALASTKNGLKQDVYRSALNAMDSEIAEAMNSAGSRIGNDAIGEQYRAAVMGQKMAEEMGGHIQSRLGKELHGSGFFQPEDMSTVAMGTMMGHPLAAIGAVASRGAYRAIGRAVEPAMAEAAYRNAVGAEAASATVNVGNRVTSTFRKFMGLGGKVAALEAADSARPKYTVKGYKDTMELSDKLTGSAHKAKVDDLVAAMSQMGHPELADQMAAQYMRATEYLNFNRPKDAKLKEAGSLGKMPARLGLDTKEMRYMDIFHAVSKPMAVVDGILDGTTSRTAVNALAYVMPEWHQDIVSRSAQVILEAKDAGKFLPADKIALLGVVLNAPVDSKLEKSFIDEVQKGLQANAQPQPEQGKAQPPGQMMLAQTADYKTPMQTSLG